MHEIAVGQRDRSVSGLECEGPVLDIFECELLEVMVGLADKREMGGEGRASVLKSVPLSHARPTGLTHASTQLLDLSQPPVLAVGDGEQQGFPAVLDQHIQDV